MPKYYNENRRKAMECYRKKRKTIQSTLTFKAWKKDLIEEQAAKRGLSMNRYFLGMMEKDAQGKVYIIPDMDKNEAITRVRELANMDATDEKVSAMMGALAKREASAVTELSADTGVDAEKILRTLLASASMELTYITAETIIKSLEEYGAGRDALFTAMRAAGTKPVLPDQCVRSNIKEPEEED